MLHNGLAGEEIASQQDLQKEDPLSPTLFNRHFQQISYIFLMFYA